ncbi:MAG: class I SAM-dependent methyltransferase [Alphaproteobacteria bacterium]|jgi:predicted nicotinamide N-methyase
MREEPPVSASADPAGFICGNTVLGTAPLVDEIELYLAHETQPLWMATEAELDVYGLPAPYWAFAWAGGQAIARYILDHPETVRGKRVFDFASGSGLVAIAAIMAGAASVTANDIDPFAITAMALNASANEVSITTEAQDLIGDPLDDVDIVLAGDVCYEQPMADRTITWLRGLANTGKPVLLGDPGRAYLPRDGMEWVIRYGIMESSAVEDTDARNTIVWRLTPDP